MPASRLAPASTVTLLLLFAVTLGAVVYFDLATNLPFNDEWFYRWTVSNLAAGRGFHMWPNTPVVSLVQLLVAAVPALLHLPDRFGRLTVLPFWILQVVYAYKLARLLGAERFWAIAAAAIPALNPIELSVATSLMSDVAYAGLAMAAAYHGVRWVRDGQDRAWCVGWLLLAGSQRQLAAAFIPALVLGLVIASRRRKLTSRDWVGFVAAVAAVAVALGIPYLFGFASPAMRGFTGQASGDLAGKISNVLFFLPPLLGFVMIPLAAALAFRAKEEKTRGALAFLPIGLAASWLALVVGRILTGGFAGFFPGNYWNIFGLGPLQLGGTKPELFPHWLYLSLDATMLATIGLLLVWRRKLWLAALSSPEGVLLIAFVLGQVGLFVTNYTVFDRHYVGVFGPLAPLLVARLPSRVAGRWPGRGWIVRGWAVALIAFGVAAYVVGQQDYEAWQNAREEASKIVFSQAPASQVDAGFEADAVYYSLPRYEQTGDYALNTTIPVLRLVNSGPDDPRPGAVYRSLAPGKIVVAPGAEASTPNQLGGHAAVRYLRYWPFAALPLALLVLAAIVRYRRAQPAVSP